MQLTSAKMKVGSKIRKIRELKGYSQEYVASQLSLTTKGYSNIENNITKVSIERLASICSIFEITPEAMIDFDLEKSIKEVSFLSKNQKENDSQVILSLVEKERELYETRISDLESQVEFLRKMLENFINQDK